MMEDEKENEIIIGRNWNARVGIKGSLYIGEEGEEEGSRASKDKLVNTEGERMMNLVEERGWHILNG